jgi:hypothetical protein
MTMPKSTVQCGECHLPLTEATNEPDRQPSPGCGSTQRVFNRAVVETIPFNEMLGTKVNNPSFPGRGHIRIEQQAGDDFHRATSKWNKKERIIDRENDRYLEKITDAETGAVTRLCDEPLSHHVGHGSAKR